METQVAEAGPRAPDRRRRLWAGAAVVLYAALALASTWPLAARLGDDLPCGSESSATVPLASAWALWWNTDRLEHGFADYWQAPIFAPAADTFALSEPAPLTGAVAAALLAATDSLAWSYGALVLLALLTNGVAARWLLRRLGIGQAAALAGGAMVVLLPYLHAELGVLPLLSLAPMLLAIGALHAIAERPTWRRGAGLGVAFAATWMTCAQYAVILALALAAPAIFLIVTRWRSGTPARRAPARALGVALLVSGVLLTPVLAGPLRARGEYDLDRSDETVRGLSAGMRHYARAPWPELVPTPGITTPARGRRALYPGTAKVALAVAALVALRRRRDRRRLRAAALAIGAAAMIVGLGPLIDAGPVSVHGALAAAVPGFGQIRSLHRAAVLVQLVVVFLAAESLDAAIAARSRRGGSRRRRGAIAAMIGAVAVLAVIELWPRDQLLREAPPEARHRGWTSWLASQTAPDAIIAHLPFAPTAKSDAFETTGAWMYLQRLHQRPMANGYSSFFPPAHDALWRRMHRFPDDKSLDALRDAGISYAVVERASYPTETTAAQPRLAPMFHDDVAGVDVYAVGR